MIAHMTRIGRIYRPNHSMRFIYLTYYGTIYYGPIIYR